MATLKIHNIKIEDETEVGGGASEGPQTAPSALLPLHSSRRPTKSELNKSLFNASLMKAEGVSLQTAWCGRQKDRRCVS